MKILFDLFPILLFFVAYKLGDIYVATGVAMASTVGQLAWLKLRKRPIEVMHWLSFGIIVVFGGATLWLKDPAFIKWKPTVLFWLFAAILIGGQWTGKNPIKALLGQQIALPASAWGTLNLSWAIFFAIMGGLNLLVAHHYDEETWVNFKLFGITGLQILFVIAQSFWLVKYMQEPGADTPTGTDAVAGNSVESK